MEAMMSRIPSSSSWSSPISGRCGMLLSTSVANRGALLIGAPSGIAMLSGTLLSMGDNRAPED